MKSVPITRYDLCRWVVKEMRVHKKTVLMLNSTKHEYKEVFLIQLYGAFVKRSKGTTDICFQFPKPNFQKLKESLKEIVLEFESSPGPHHSPSSSSSHRREKDVKPFDSKGSNITIKVWAKQKDEKLKAKLLVSQLDSTLVKHVPTWLKVGRVLRSLSRGSNDLLSAWTDWTNKAVIPGKGATQCRNIWNAFRPVTNCDEASIVMLRNFFQSYDFSNKHSGERVRLFLRDRIIIFLGILSMSSGTCRELLVPVAWTD